MFKFLIILLSLMATVMANDPNAIIAKANQAFEKANELAMSNPSESQEIYEAVIIKYRFVLEEKEMKTSSLHKNLGNAYWFSGDKGRAILHYQRGLHLAPDNDDLKHNLAFARSQVVDELDETTLQKLTSYLMFWHHWPVSARMILLFIFNSTFFVLCALLLSRQCRVMKYIRIATGVFAVIFALSLLANLNNWDNDVDGVVVAQEVTSRQGNGHIYESAMNTPLHSGTEFKLIEQRGDWCHIELMDESTCWLPSTELALIIQ